MPNDVIKFAEFELDGGRYELRRGETVLKLEKIPMNLLTILVESNGQLVTRDEIIEKIWGKDVFLDTEHGINTAIRKIRQVLADDPDQPRFVQTVTGKGYRFIAPTSTTPSLRGNGNLGAIGSAFAKTAEPELRSRELDRESTDGAIPVVALGTQPRRSVLRRVGLVLVGAIVIAAALIGFDVRGVRARWFSSVVKPRIHSLAVLPLENLSADPAQDYFADGMTDELITMLAKNPGLRVTSRTSVMQYKKVRRPLPDIARELGVDGILEGSVGRTGNRVHINAQLIYAPKDMHVWAESYDRDLSDLSSLQSDLAQTIARQVGLTASAASTPVRHINPEAHDAYLMGRYYWFSREYNKGEEYFQKAIRLQPDYAAAWSGVADYYTASAVEGEILAEAALPQAEPAARKAVALDDSLAEAHNALAAVYYFLRWDWDAAERESARAIEVNPQLSEAHHLRSYILGTLQRTEESLQEDRKSMELDPFVHPWALGYSLFRARRFDAALSELRLRSEAQPGDCIVHTMLSEVYMQKGMAAESVQEQKQCLLLSGEKQGAAELEQAFRDGGIRGVYELQLGQLQKAAAKGHVPPLEFATAYARLGRADETIHFLERAYKERAPWLVHIQNEPDYDFVHSDPRYQAIVRKMGLPQVP